MGKNQTRDRLVREFLQQRFGQIPEWYTPVRKTVYPELYWDVRLILRRKLEEQQYE